MGARAQVKIKDTGVYLYTHWGSGSIVQNVQRVIQKGQRLGDPEYFTRILFDQLSKGQTGESTGFGIGTRQYGDIETLVEVDLRARMVRIEKVYNGQAIELTFDEFTAL